MTSAITMDDRQQLIERIKALDSLIDYELSCSQDTSVTESRLEQAKKLLSDLDRNEYARNT